MMKRGGALLLRRLASSSASAFTKTNSGTFASSSAASASAARGCVFRGNSLRRHSICSSWRAFTTSDGGGGKEAEEEQKKEKKKELYMAFTCGKCETRSIKGFSKRAYHFGVVVVTCPGCERKHVVADRLGWFGEKGDAGGFYPGEGKEEEGRERGGGEGDDDASENRGGWDVGV
ncbi:unnamed protein product [Bathycoccus prasinos]